MVVNTEPFVATYVEGYIRRTLENYDPFSKNRFVHLVNHEV